MRWVLLTALLASCGGGSSSAPDVPPVQRHDVLFGYYAGSSQVTAETADHANLAVGLEAAVDVVQAVSVGMKVMLAVCWKCGVDQLRWQFTQLHNAGVLGGVVALYPQDEPDVAGMSDDDVRTMVALVRGVAGEFTELSTVPIAAIYGNVGTAGIEYFDWIGRDNYGTGPIVPIRTGNQRVMLAPGGADPWREDPTAFVDTANRTPAVVAIIPFLWRYPNGSTGGIATNGMAPKYRAAGTAMTH